MPRIAAATVAEHRAQVQTRLVDAAEDILRAGDGAALTAGAVSSAAGIARNSIYRYVDSVEDLRFLVVARYLPSWLAAVDEAVAGAEDPRSRLTAWVTANLEQAAATGHGWLMEAMRAAPVVAPPAPAAGTDAPGAEAVETAHAALNDVVQATWLELLGGDQGRSAVAGAMTMAIVETGFRQLDAGQPAGLVTDMSTRAVAGLVAAFTA
ncbi:TetR/AcrR family transcriptional regulator [Intrasporangium mesophilum]